MHVANFISTGQIYFSNFAIYYFSKTIAIIISVSIKFITSSSTFEECNINFSAKGTSEICWEGPTRSRGQPY